MNSLEGQTDLRVRRTQKLLWEALISLMENQDFESISIKDICDRAMVHRTTFYKHYQDKYDLLMSGMRVMHNQLKKAQQTEKQTSQEDSSYRMFISLCKHVAENEHFYRLMLCGDGIGTFYTLLRTYLAEIGQTQLTKVQQAGRELPAPIPIFAQFWAGAIISSIIWWLENDLPYSPEQMATHMASLMANASMFLG